MLGVGDLNWYPNRNPSEEIRSTTGWERVLRERALVWGAKGGVLEVEKKRKAKAEAEARAMQVVRVRAMKMAVVVADFGGRLGVESVLKERRAVDGFGWSLVMGIRVGLVGIGVKSAVAISKLNELMNRLDRIRRD